MKNIIARCRQEYEELNEGGQQNLSAPALVTLLGIPRAGKSATLKWTRRFFEECLGWEHGVQFQFLASQNTMAALIGGTTVHSWAVIPINADDAAQKASSRAAAGDVDELFLNALSMRFIFIDEVSTLSPTLLGTLNVFLQRACTRHPYAKVDGHKRMFGGINMILCGDFLQLPPVKAISLFANPFKSGYSVEDC